MSLAPRLDLRQSQSLVMSPQLQQAIKLLALSNLEIEAFVGTALADNPLLDTGVPDPGPDDLPPAPEPAPPSPDDHPAADSADWPAHGADSPEWPTQGADSGDWSAQGVATPSSDAAAPSLDDRGAAEPTLAQHLEAQIGAVARDPAQLFVARHLIGLLDEAGYLTVPLEEVARDLDIAAAEAEAALAAVQSLDPTGVGARSLSECLALQAREADRYDPCMALLLDNLDLVAKGAFAQLRRLCRVDEEDFADMLRELRGYDPKPGLRHGGAERVPIVPDILVHPRPGGWDIALNPDTLPRLVVNRAYYLELRDSGDPATRGWLSERLADANWLVKALDQRQKTILKVAAEIVAQQDGFFRHGVSRLRPLTLRAIAERIAMHESTVSRVTSNKYLQCDRGLFELKYFFTSGIASSDGEGTASAESVKAQIRALIDAERPDAVLSDDALVDLLRDRGIPYVFATGYGRGILAPQYAGTPLIEKPYRAEQLHDALERILGG